MIEQQDKAIHYRRTRKSPVPCATVCLLMLGPGTSSLMPRSQLWGTMDVWSAGAEKRASDSMLAGRENAKRGQPAPSGTSVVRP